MSFLKSWFSKRKSDDDYESVLQSLKVEIETCQTRLNEIRVRERRATLTFTIYTFVIWSAYSLLWYTNLIPGARRGSERNQWERALKSLPVIVGPIVILFMRRIVQLWYARKGATEEQHLKKLLTKQRNIIEDIKKKTNYYSTKNLLERYDEPSSSRSTPQSSPAALRRRSMAPPNGMPTSPLTASPSTPARGQTSLAASASSRPNGETSTLLSPVQMPMQPPKRQWYDRLADVVLGEDDVGATQPHTRYALICQNCFAHNGLVRESEWATTQYRCPKCNYFNPAPGSKKSKTPPEPQSPSTLSNPNPNSSSLPDPSRTVTPPPDRDGAHPPSIQAPSNEGEDGMDVDRSMIS